MERRFTAFLIPIALLGLFLLLFQQPKAPTTETPTAARAGQHSVRRDTAAGDVWRKDFGLRDGVGFQVTFDNRVGGIREVRMLDHYVTVAAKKQASHEDTDYYPIVEPAVAGLVAFMLEEERGFARRFKRVHVDGDKDDSGEYARWQPTDGDNEVKFTLDCKDGRVLEKRFYHEPGRRDLGVTISLRNTGVDDADAGQLYPLVLRGVTLPNPRSERVLGGNPALALGATRDPATGRATHYAPKDWASRANATVVAAQGDARFAWGGVTNRFFGGFLYPVDDEAARHIAHMRVEPLPEADDAERDLAARSVPFGEYLIHLRVPKNGESSSLPLRVYLGPKSFEVFEEREEYRQFLPVMDEDLTPPPCLFCTVPGVTWMAKNLLYLLEFLHKIVGNWGIAIILLTILVRTAVFFLNFRSQKSMRTYGARMAQVKPELDAIQAKHKDNPKQLQAAMMELYRKHKMFPPLGGCLPLFLTIPVFFGLFTALRVSYDLRHQPFMLWIDDLSAPDALFDLGWSLVPHFNVLPIVWMVLYSIMMFRMKLPADPQQRMVQQMMRWMFLAFGVLLYNYASGLLVYMCTSMALSFLEQWIIKKILGPMPEIGGVAQMPTL
jgi:YidC/Oxa1 family membrane protein insertase